MTTVTLYDTTILCDELGCKRRFRLPWDYGFARILAAVEGWSHKATPQDRDLCPDHRAVNDRPTRSEG